MMGEAKRDPRRTTLLKAQVRGEHGWSEALVCNLSAHGLMLRGVDLPRRGSFIEISCDKTRAVGQVRWSIGSRCGVRTREAIDPAAWLGHHGEDRAGCGGAPPPVVLRPTPQDSAAMAARGALFARLANLLVTATLLAAAAWLAVDAVTGLLGTPLHRIGTQLAPVSAPR
ncbi:hypothetical protein ACFOD9_02180 [Novosphingobium bradum]|uniref:PilZ domain-containing protein n=1 Tax=Novosphingobium bradum TaxID=1737444 RepID=A0ABV7IQB7_9SPHN